MLITYDFFSTFERIKINRVKKLIITPIFFLCLGAHIAFAQEQLQFEKKEIQFGELYNPTENTVYIYLQFEIPISPCDTALQHIRTQILSKIFETPTDSIITDSATLVHLFIGEGAGDILEADWHVNYEKTINGRVAFSNINIVSYAVGGYEYSGGAHGYTSLYYFVFDLKTGKRLTEADIFTGNYEEVLTKILLKKLESEDCFAGFYIDKVRPNGNFFINEKGITYFFNSYEIAAYACGNFEVFIPFEELHTMMQRNLFAN